jgi:hypothetical protein
MRESRIEYHLVKRVRALGGWCVKVQWIGRRGAPDRIVLIPGREHFWVELKAPGLAPEPHQAREHARMRSCGCRVEVIDSLQRCDEVLDA